MITSIPICSIGFRCIISPIGIELETAETGFIFIPLVDAMVSITIYS